MLRTNTKFAHLLALMVATIFSCTTSFAQELPQKPGGTAKPANTKHSLLGLLRYDPKRQGPLLCVAQDRLVREYDASGEKSAKQIAENRTPAQFAEQVGARALTVGEITAIVPRTMTEIVNNPGKPDSYAGLDFEQRLVLVLATFTPDQWKQAGGADGIGLAELRDGQRALLDGIWREKTAKIRSTRISKERNFYGSGEEETVAISDLRLRLSRSVSLHLQPVGDGDGAAHRPEHHDPRRETEPEEDGSYSRQHLEMPRVATDGEGGEKGTRSAFGVPVIRTVPNRLKSGHLALDAPALTVGVRLDGSHGTVGALLAAAARSTRLPLVSDKRLAALQVGYRVAPGGQVVSAGDVLKALCRSVTGTFRRLDGPNGASVYLLTDDVEGIGTRFARLDRWAERASDQRGEANWKAIEDCAVNDPLDSLGFAPGYPFALSGDHLKTIDNHYRAGRWEDEVLFPVSELPAALREEVTRGIESTRKWKSGVALRTDRVGLDTQFHCDWVVPGGRSFAALSDESILSLVFLRQVAISPAERTARREASRKKSPVPAKFPSALKRRLLVAPLPETEEDMKSLFVLLRRKGFNEAWFGVARGDTATRERLQTAIALGKKSALRVGVVIPWLRKEEAAAAGKPVLDMNILGESGAELVEIEMGNIVYKQFPAWARDRDANWVVPDARDVQNIVGRVSPFLAMSGLSAVAFTNPAPAGYADEEPHLGFQSGVRMGYSDPLRFRCVMEEGFDPVDVVERTSYLRVPTVLPFFRYDDDEVNNTLARFRSMENKKHLARIHAALRKDFPRTPMYLDDSGGHTFDFYGRWAKPEGFPAPGNRNDSDAKQIRARAFQIDPAPVFAVRGEFVQSMSVYFWDAWKRGAEEAAKGWGGFALKMTNNSSEEVSAFLAELPDDPTRPK